jgi:hypothetical protein
MNAAKRELARKLDAAGWGLFFIWVGIAVLASVGWSATLLGVGVIVLAGQLARKISGLPVGVFWVLIGGLLVVGGIWDVLDVGTATGARLGVVVAILCILAGGALLFSASFRRPRAAR